MHENRFNLQLESMFNTHKVYRQRLGVNIPNKQQCIYYPFYDKLYIQNDILKANL